MKITTGMLKKMIREELERASEEGEQMITVGVAELRRLVMEAYKEGFEKAPEDYYRASRDERDADVQWEGSYAMDKLNDLIQKSSK
jgi:DNA repair photolyase